MLPRLVSTVSPNLVRLFDRIALQAAAGRSPGIAGAGAAD